LVISVESAAVRPDLLGHAIQNPYWWLGLLLVCAAAITLISGLATRRETLAFIGSNLLLAGLLATLAAAIFPVVLHSTLAPENSLTVYDVAAGPNSLAYAAIWWPFAFALTIAYFVFVSRRYAGKVSVNRDNQGFYETQRNNAPGSSPITSAAHSAIHDITNRTRQHRRN
jgi:cytochrome d ubiquinol oxidase subunit II